MFLSTLLPPPCLGGALVVDDEKTKARPKGTWLAGRGFRTGAWGCAASASRRRPCRPDQPLPCRRPRRPQAMFGQGTTGRTTLSGLDPTPAEMAPLVAKIEEIIARGK